jgi:hypothetical protein
MAANPNPFLHPNQSYRLNNDDELNGILKNSLNRGLEDQNVLARIAAWKQRKANKEAKAKAKANKRQRGGTRRRTRRTRRRTHRR